MVSIQHLVKRYGARLAVDDLSFEVPAGRGRGLLGAEWRRKEHDASRPRRVSGDDERQSHRGRRRRHDRLLRRSLAHRLHARGRPALPRDARVRVPRVPSRAEGGPPERAPRQRRFGDGEGKRHRRREPPHRKAVEGLPAARRPRRRPRGQTAAPRPRRADRGARPQPDRRSPRRHQSARSRAHGPPLDAHPQ